MNDIFCDKKCCNLKYIKGYNILPYHVHKHKKKAGIFIHDSKSNKILLVQSRGRLWGPPKGTMEDGEHENQCAKREVKEETGLDIDISSLSDYFVIRNRATYFYMDIPYTELNIQTDLENNDVTGIGWISPECLVKCVQTQTINITTHCKILLKKILNIDI